MKKNKINKLIKKINNRLEEQRLKTPLKGPSLDPTSNPNYGLDVLGCTDPLANNYDASATCDNGNCCYLPTPSVVTINTDGCSAWRLSWELRDDNGFTIASGGNNSGTSGFSGNPVASNPVTSGGGAKKKN